MTGAPSAPLASAEPLTSPTQVSRYGEALLAVATVIAVSVYVVIGIDRSVWLDEANSILIANQGWQGILNSLRHDNNLPGYYFLLSLWMRVFGNSEIALRALSAVFYLAGGRAVYSLGKRICGDTRTAAYCVFFYLCSPLAVRQAQNIRMYALLGLVSALSSLWFIRIFRDGDNSRRGLIWFSGIATAGLLTHVWFSFALFAQFVTLVILDRKQIWRWITGAGSAAALFLLFWGPALSDQLRNGATDWMVHVTTRTWFFAFLEFYGPGPSLVLYVLAAGLLFWDRRKRETSTPHKTGAAWMAALFVAGYAAPLLVSSVRPIYWPGRYNIITLPAAAVVLAGILAPRVKPAILPLLCVLLLTLGVTVQVSGSGDVPDASLRPGQSDRTSAQYLLQHAAPGDIIVFTSLTRAAADYYFLRGGAAHRFVEINFPAEVATHLGWMDMRVSAQNQPRLDAEANAAVLQIQEVLAAGGSAWIYEGFGGVITKVLTGRLDSTFPARSEHALEGPYHKRIVEIRSADARR